MGDLTRIALLDGDGAAVGDGPVDGRIGQRHEEGNVVVARGERLEVGADLVGDVAAACGAIGADDAEIDELLLHQITAGVVGDDGVRHAMGPELERRQRRPLIARPGLVDPDVKRDTVVIGAVDRRQRRTPIDGGEPAGVAMGENVDALTALLVGMRLDQPVAVLADLAAGFHVVVADLGGLGIGGSHPRLARLVAHRLLHLAERPAKIDGRGPCRGERLAGPLERVVRYVIAERKGCAIGRGGADQRRTPDLHCRDGPGGVFERFEGDGLEGEWKLGLIDDLDRPPVGVQPDGPVVVAVDVHGP